MMNKYLSLGNVSVTDILGQIQIIRDWTRTHDCIANNISGHTNRRKNYASDSGRIL